MRDQNVASAATINYELKLLRKMFAWGIRGAVERDAVRGTGEGNSLKGTNNSRSPTNSQNPCGEMLVTSTAGVLD